MSDPNPVPDERLLSAVDTVLEAGERDLLGGGVVAEDLSDEIDLGTSQIQKRLLQLADADHLTCVYGANPETFEPRRSYLPADHPDASTATGQH